MGIEDTRTLVKAVKSAGKKADEVAAVARAADDFVVYEFRGVEYAFPKGTKKDDAIRYLWKNVVGPQVRGKEEKITLPSELPSADILTFPRVGIPESITQKDEIIEETHKASTLDLEVPTVIPVEEKKPKKLDPGVYIDEDSGKYFRIDREGNMTELNDETP